MNETPDTPTPAPTVDQDLEHLKILSIFHYVLAAIVALIGCIPLIHFVLGAGLASGTLGDGPEEGAAVVGCFFMAVAAGLILFAWGYAICLVFAGRFLADRRNYTFCLVVAGIACLFMPIGTVLGVFTILVLLRPSVRARFG